MNAWFQAHSLLCLLTLAALGTVFWVWTQRERLSLRLPWVILLSLLHVAVGVCCVKAFAALEAGSLSAAGNMSLFGAVFFLPLFYWLVAKLGKRKTADVFDVFVVPMIFTLACARVNCLFSGCCLGLPISGTSLRWPTREAELLYYAVILFFFVRKTLRGKTDGTLYPIYMISYGILRFFLEFLRVSPTHTLFHLSHLWALLCLLTGLSFLWQKQQKQRPRKQPSRRRNK